MHKFVRLPNRWIEDHGLHAFGWKDHGSSNLAALMVLAVIAHHIDPETGVARLTYSEISEKASLSRAMVSAGLTRLRERKLVLDEPKGRSTVGLAEYDPKQGWAMMPAAGLYHNGEVAGFRPFRLRRRTELDAMKLYFLFVSRRSRQQNMALLSYEKIEFYSAVPRSLIRDATSLLSANGLIRIEHLSSEVNEHATSNGYRISYLEPRQHMGTSGKITDATAHIGPIV
jgi:DNA-binding transcriptional ArsR family regulator